MPNNVIFNLLETIPLTELEQINVVQKKLFYKDTSFKYYLFNLPKPQKTVFGPYTLQEHHLTVNANERGEDDALHQYHYTAFFLDKEGKKYRLHCYYNAKDQLAELPALHLEKGSDNYERVNYEDEPYNLYSFARESIKKLKDKLRAAQQAQVTALQETYEKLNAEAEALSVDIKTNKEAYLKVNQLQIDILNELQRYANPDQSRGYRNTLTMLMRISKAVKELSTTPQPLYLVPPDNKDNKVAEDTSATDESASNKNEVPQKNKNNLDDAIKKLKNELVLLMKMPVIQLVDPILQFFKNFVDVSVSNNATAKNLHDLKVIETELDAVAKKLIYNLWQLKKENTPELLVKLKPFHHLIPANLIFIALKLNDSVMLNFLLEFKISRLNDRYFTVGDDGQQYSSLIDYCFKRSKVVPVKAEMLTCLSILVARGLSLLEIDNTTGLPFAANLLLNPDHPFYDVLNRNKKLTIENPSFCEALRIKLNLIITQPNLSPQLKAKIQALLIQNDPFHSNGKNTVQYNSISTASNQFHTEMLAVYGGDLASKIKEDPDISKLLKARNAVQKNVLDKMSLQVRAAAIKAFKEENSLLISLFQVRKSLGITTSFEAEKKASIDKLKLQIRLLTLKEEHLETIAEIRKKVAYTPNQVAYQRRLVEKQIEIIKEMQKIQEQLSAGGIANTQLNGMQELVASDVFKKSLGADNAAAVVSDAKNPAPNVSSAGMSFFPAASAAEQSFAAPKQTPLVTNSSS